MSRSSLRLVAALIAVGTLVATGSRADIALKDGWVAETPPSALATAAFGKLANDGDEPVVIVGATSPSCETVEIHRTVDEDGIARMQRVDRLEIAPGQELALEPGGMHWMLIRPSSLAAGDEIVIQLQHADGTSTELQLPVRRHGKRDAHAHH